jgi:hypothetical protein
MATDFLTEVRGAFGFLARDYDLRLASHSVADSFDNAAVEFEGPLRVTVIRERSQIFVDVRPPGPHSFDLALLLRWLGADSDLHALLETGQTSVDLVADLFRRHFPAIQSGFTRERAAESARELLELRELWAIERWGPLPS